MQFVTCSDGMASELGKLSGVWFSFVPKLEPNGYAYIKTS